MVIAIAVCLGFIGLGILFFNSGINFVFPLNNKLIWLVIFTLLTIPGFFIGHKEATLLNKSGYSNIKNNTILWLIGLIPFFFISIFFLPYPVSSFDSMCTFCNFLKNTKTLFFILKPKYIVYFL